jgi:hypothetical protein
MEYRGRHPLLAFLGRFSRRTLITVAAIVLLLVIGRILLPGFLQKQINTRLANIPGYTGHVLLGGYSMQHLVIQKKTGQELEPFINTADIHFSLAYRQLLHGRIVSDVIIDRAEINFVRSPSPEESQDLGKAPQAGGHAPAPDKRWQDVVHDLFPLDITHLELSDSRIHYVDTVNQPRIDLAVDHLQLSATGLQNRSDPKGGPLPARITLTGETIGRGKLSFFMALEPLAETPHFQLHASVEDLSLPALNQFLIAYVGVDVSQGTFQLYTEVNGVNGQYEGYFKPLLTNLNFQTKSDEKKNPFQRLWKDLVSATTKVLRDRNQKQVATLIPFSGQFSKGTDIQVWTTVGNLFRNGFIEAIRRGLEGNAGIRGEKVKGAALPPDLSAAEPAALSAAPSSSGPPAAVPSADKSGG